MSGHKKAAKKPAAKQAAAKKKPAAKQVAKRPPEPEIQVNRVTENDQTPPQTDNEQSKQEGETSEQTPPQVEDAKTTTPKDEISKEDERGMQTPKEGPDPDRDTTSPEDDAERPTVTEQVSDVEYEPKRLPLEHEGFDHHGAEERRQDELATSREKHNKLTSGFARS